MNWIKIDEQVPPLNYVKLIAYDDGDDIEVTIGYRQTTKLMNDNTTTFLSDIYIDLLTGKTINPVAWCDFPEYKN